MLFVGGSPLTDRMVQAFARTSRPLCEVVGRWTPDEAHRGNGDELVELARSRGVDEIVLPTSLSNVQAALLPALRCLPLGCRVRSEADELGEPLTNVALRPDVPDHPDLRAEILRQLALLARSQADPLDKKASQEILGLPRDAPLDERLSELGVGGSDPLGGIAPPVRVLYLEALQRVGLPGEERLVSLVKAAQLELGLRGRALASPSGRKGVESSTAR